MIQLAAPFLVGSVPLPAISYAGLSPSVTYLGTDGAQGTFLRADIAIK